MWRADSKHSKEWKKKLKHTQTHSYPNIHLCTCTLLFAVSDLARTMCCPVDNTPAVCNNWFGWIFVVVYCIQQSNFRRGNETIMEIFLPHIFFSYIFMSPYRMMLSSSPIHSLWVCVGINNNNNNLYMCNSVCRIFFLICS